jgi:hypothetical protein
MQIDTPLRAILRKRKLTEKQAFLAICESHLQELDLALQNHQDVMLFAARNAALFVNCHELTNIYKEKEQNIDTLRMYRNEVKSLIETIKND